MFKFSLTVADYSLHCGNIWLAEVILQHAYIIDTIHNYIYNSPTFFKLKHLYTDYPTLFSVTKLLSHWVPSKTPLGFEHALAHVYTI